MRSDLRLHIAEITIKMSKFLIICDLQICQRNCFSLVLNDSILRILPWEVHHIGLSLRKFFVRSPGSMKLPFWIGSSFSHTLSSGFSLPWPIPWIQLWTEYVVADFVPGMFANLLLFISLSNSWEFKSWWNIWYISCLAGGFTESYLPVIISIPRIFYFISFQD